MKLDRQRMKKSTRAPTGMVMLDALLVAGAAWMIQQTKSGAWNASDPAATITEIVRTAGGSDRDRHGGAAGGALGASAAGGLG